MAERKMQTASCRLLTFQFPGQCFIQASQVFDAGRESFSIDLSQKAGEHLAWPDLNEKSNTLRAEHTHRLLPPNRSGNLALQTVAYGCGRPHHVAISVVDQRYARVADLQGIQVPGQA